MNFARESPPPNERAGAVNFANRLLKDLTHTTSRLLAFGCAESAAMPRTRTHFEQISLDMVKKIVEEQIRLEETDEDLRRERPRVLAHDATPLPRKNTGSWDQLHSHWRLRTRGF